ncbi:response regulator transcription factor [Thermodesulfobacteriota bacterium]
MKTAKASILVVEDDPGILRGLLDVLVFNGYAVEGAEDGREGLQKALQTRYDLLVLDVMLPGLDGFAVCRRVRNERPSQAIVMLTAKGAEDDVVAGFRAGADDYVTKPFSLRELMVRVEAVLRRSGKSLGDEKVTYRGILFDGPTLTAAFMGSSVELTRREMDIMVYLHRHMDRIVSKRELLKEVWQYADPTVETRTVDIHILKLRKKIASLTSGISCIQTVRGEGYRLEPEP